MSAPPGLHLYQEFACCMAGSLVWPWHGLNLRAALLRRSYLPAPAADKLWRQVNSFEVQGANYCRDGSALEIRPAPWPGAGPALPWAATLLHWPHHPSGFADARRLVLFQGASAGQDGRLLAYSDDFGADAGNRFGDLTIVFRGGRLFTPPRRPATMHAGKDG